MSSWNQSTKLAYSANGGKRKATSWGGRTTKVHGKSSSKWGNGSSWGGAPAPAFFVANYNMSTIESDGKVTSIKVIGKDKVSAIH